MTDFVNSPPSPGTRSAGAADNAVRRRRQASMLITDDAKAREEMVRIYAALGDEKVTLNVCGIIHKTYYRTLARWPGTRLFGLAYQHAINPDTKAADFFFDQDPNVFSSVLDYYRHGQLYICSLCIMLVPSVVKIPEG